MINRTVSAQLTVDVSSAARLALQVAVAHHTELEIAESIELTLDGAALHYDEIDAPAGGRIWVVDVQPGQLELSYRAQVAGAASPMPVTVADELLYLRPSRYCESDRMIGFAARHFHDITNPTDILAAVSSWVGIQLEYVSGSSGPTDGAVETLLAGRGVCRDYAHLAVSLLRAMQIPARLVAVYAPGLDPMDFHAVAEALIGDAWYVVDGTLLAPRESLLRIATGRDAADTSFLSSYHGAITLNSMTVTATVDGPLPTENVQALTQLH